MENKPLEDPNVKQPKFYRRYVDDIFAIFESTADRDAFYDLLNNAHKNLEFTVENVDISSKSLPFLDVEVRITESDQFETQVYRKPTNTNVLLNYDAVAPTKWKRAIIKGFLNRARRITSSEKLFNKELVTIKNIFRANGYPIRFINQTVDEHLQANSFGEMYKSADDNIGNNILRKHFFVVPYIGKASIQLQRRIKKELLQHDILVQAAYRTTKVGSYLGLKSTIPSLFKTDVVYKFQCPHDENIHYIGETQRQFFKRISNHCPATSTTSTSSAVYDHILPVATIVKIIPTFFIASLSSEAVTVKMYWPRRQFVFGNTNPL